MGSLASNLRRRKAKKETVEIDITSLLDILTILLVFLLRSYNATDLKLEVVKDVNVAVSESEDLGSHAVILQVNDKKELYLNTKKVADLDEKGMGAEILEGLLKVEAEKMRKELALLDRRPASTDPKPQTESKDKPGERPLNVNFVFDEKTPYELMAKVMHFASKTGHTKYKFIVQGRGQ